MADLCSSRSQAFRRFLTPTRRALARLALLVLLFGGGTLTVPPPGGGAGNFAVAAAAQETQEQAFERKADKLTRLVRRAAQTEGAAAGKGRAASDGDDRAAESDAGREGNLSRLSRIASVTRRADGLAAVSVLVGLAEESAEALKAANFAVGARIGKVATVETTADRLAELAALPAVRRLEMSTMMRPLNDLARRTIKIDNAAGTRQVAQDGTGVAVGIVDSGVDFRHPDFTVPGSNGRETRIKFMLDMTVYSQAGAEWRWNYTLPGQTAQIGRLYTAADINEALQLGGRPTQAQDRVKMRDRSGHGTHIAATAAGNGLANPSDPGRYAGMAPRADLIVVKATRADNSRGTFSVTDQVNAMQFVQVKAAELGEPFVINVSIGGHVGPHNGTNRNEEAIDALVNGGTGRAVCVAAGNEGDASVHASGNLTQGGEIELRVAAPGTSPNYFEFYYPSADRFSVTITKPNGATLGPYVFGTDADNPDPDPAIDWVFNNLDPPAGLNDIFIVFNDPAATNLGPTWRFRISAQTVNSGTGRFDVWLGDGRFDDDDVAGNAPPTYVDPARTVSSPGNARGAITVGAFVTQSQVQTPGQAAVFTSVGPTADGRAKPDISAPGRYLYSALSADLDAQANFGANPQNLPAPLNTLYTAEAGTSMATPVVTGTVALILQARRDLDIIQIKRFLTNYADSDSYALPGWDPRFGYGKLNAQAALAAAAGAPDGSTNAIKDPGTFVRRQYLDFLNREPEQPGFNSWLDTLNACAPNDAACDRTHVSSAFFLSEEFRVKGYFIYRYYRASFGRRPRYTEMIPDMRAVTGLTGDERIAKQNNFVNAWVARPDFKLLFPDAMGAADFVGKLELTAGVTLAARAQLINELAGGVKTRAQVLREVVESREMADRYYNEAFVAMQYFGYLRRDPEEQGFNDWLNTINANPADVRRMVGGFVNSREYIMRFGYLAGQ